MPLLTDPSKLETPKSIIGMLYGQPGSQKTTTALSAPNCVLLDFDRGLHRTLGDKVRDEIIRGDTQCDTLEERYHHRIDEVITMLATIVNELPTATQKRIAAKLYLVEVPNG